MPRTVSSINTVESHFTNRAPVVQATYSALLKAARKLGPVVEESGKTSIRLVGSSTFAGVSTRQSWLVLTLNTAADIASKRVMRHEQPAADRWQLEIRLDEPGQVDRDLVAMLEQAYSVSA
jgi:hypothetical protein